MINKRTCCVYFAAGPFAITDEARETTEKTEINISAFLFAMMILQKIYMEGSFNAGY